MKNWKLLLGFGITLTLLGALIVIGFTILNVISAAEMDAAYQACIARNGMHETGNPDEMLSIANMCAGYLE